ncbi:MAG: TonB-dependent receptor [Sphingobium sp.]
MIFTRYACVSSVLALSVGLIAATPAHAQTPADEAASPDTEIVVTAQRRAERSLDVPITLTTVTSDQLQAAGVNQLSDIARVSPALRFDTAAAWSQPSIRGIGTQVTNSGAGSNVGVYVDGFYSPNPLAADFQLMNVQSIQVLKGPQGTLFGRNTTGGAILVTTSEPSTTPAAEVKASYGSFAAKRVQGYATFGLAENVAVDVEGLFSKGRGFVHNIVTGRNDDGAYENWSVRGGLKVDLSDRASILLRYSHLENDDPTALLTNPFEGYIGGYPGSEFGVGTSFPASLYSTKPRTVATSEPTAFYSGSDIAQLTIKLDLDFADVASYSQYRTEKSLIVENIDNTAATIVNGGLLLHVGVDDETVSQEFLLTSKPGTALQWSAGLFYFRNRDTWDIRLGMPTASEPLAASRFGRSSTTTESFAAFADATYEVADNLFVTGGGRFSHDVVRDAYFTVGFFPAQGFPPNLKADKFTPRVVLRYKPTDQSSLYASFTKGYKAGTLDVGDADANRGPNDRVVQPEDINAYEVGYKFDNRVFGVDLAAFYYDYKNLQVSVFKDFAAASVLNAATSRIWGLDGQARYSPVGGLDLNIGAAYTNARYRKFQNAPVFQPLTPGGPSVPVSTSLTDVTMQRVPEFTGNIGARYKTDLGGGELALSGNLYYTSSFFFGPSGIQYKQNGYEILSLRAQWTDPSDRYTLAVYGDNLTDRDYRTQTLVNAFGAGTTWGAPATWGVQLGAKF